MRTSVLPERARPISVGRLAMVAVAALIAATLQAGMARAQSASNDVAMLRAQADDIANQYFRALTQSRALDDEIAQNAKTVDDLEAKAKQARQNARQRALLAYTTASAHLSTLIDGKNILDTARRAQLIENVNQRDNAVYARLKAATEDLRASRRVLDDARAQQATLVAQIQDQAKAIDAKLAEAQRREQTAAAAAATATSPPVVASPGAIPAAPTNGTSPPATTAPAAKPTAPTSPPGYTPTGGTNPHHDDPFLTCVRLRESGGNYSAVNPAGPYLGAYQFYQSTWNAAANHAGRSELVGVPANVASPYDQDDVAWSLYQWQGPGPWGGGCG
jgi:hypothetical protein